MAETALQPNTPQADADHVLAVRPNEPKYARLSHAEKRKILAMRRENIGYAEIAGVLKRSVSTVYEYAQPYESTVAEARASLEASASHAAAQWRNAVDRAAGKGDHRPARDLLAVVGVAAAPVEGAKVAIQVNLPGSTALPVELSDTLTLSQSTT